MRSQRWSDLTTRQRAMVLVVVAVQAAIAALAQRDLSARTAAEIRGPKAAWRLAVLNPVGALVYLVLGRTRRSLDPLP